VSDGVSPSPKGGGQSRLGPAPSKYATKRDKSKDTGVFLSSLVIAVMVEV